MPDVSSSWPRPPSDLHQCRRPCPSSQAVTCFVGAIVGDALAQRLSAPIGAFVFDAARNVQLASFGLLIGGTTAHYWCDPAPWSAMSHRAMPSKPSVRCVAAEGTARALLLICGLPGLCRARLLCFSAWIVADAAGTRGSSTRSSLGSPGRRKQSSPSSPWTRCRPGSSVLQPEFAISASVSPAGISCTPSCRHCACTR